MLTDWWIGDRTASSTTVHVRCNADETLTINGQSVSCETATLDGAARVALPMTGGQLVIQHANGIETTTVPAFPSASDTWKFGMIGCQMRYHDAYYARQLQHFGCQLMLQTGDIVYPDINAVHFEWETFEADEFDNMESTDTTQNQEQWFLHLRSLHRIPSLRRALHSGISLMHIPDDHEYYNEFDRTSYESTLDQTELDTIIAENGDVSNNAEAWEKIAEWAENGMKAYTTMPLTGERYRKLVWGNVTFLLLNCIYYRDPVVDNGVGIPAKTMLGAAQETWLLDEISAATTDFVCIGTSKILFHGFNRDGWHDKGTPNSAGYEVQRNRILQHIDATRTGVFFSGGDTHQPFVTNLLPEQAYAGSTGVFQMNHTPSNKSDDATLPESPMLDTTGRVWTNPRTRGAAGDVIANSVMGLAEVSPEKIRFNLYGRRAIEDRLWYGDLYPDKNYIIYPRRRQ